MRRFLTRYTIRYPRSLIYMLQACEYDTRAFFRWYARVGNFRAVERRKTIDWTQKARALRWIAWGFYAIMAAFAILGTLEHSSISHLLALVFVLIAPFALPYILAIAVRLGRLVQRPLERRAIDAARRKLRSHPGLRIAVAGSYGKTTTREILRAVLGAGKSVAAPPESFNTPLGIAQFIETLTGDEEVIVFELGEYRPGDIMQLCEFVRPQVGVITGVNEAHLETFGSIERTAATIFELAAYLGSHPLYVNAENPIAKAHAPAHAILYSRGGVGDWSIDGARSDLSGTRFTLHGAGISIAGESKLLGLHAVGPIAAAAHLAWGLGLTVAQIEQGIAATHPFAHRLFLSDQGGVAMLDDSYNGNPDGVRAVIDFLGSLKGRRWYVTPGLVETGDRTEAIHREIGRLLAAAKIDHIVLMRNSVTGFIEAGLRAADFKGEIRYFDDGPEAYAALPYLTAAGDIILLQNDWPDQYA